MASREPRSRRVNLEAKKRPSVKKRGPSVSALLRRLPDSGALSNRHPLYLRFVKGLFSSIWPLFLGRGRYLLELKRRARGGGDWGGGTSSRPGAVPTMSLGVPPAAAAAAPADRVRRPRWPFKGRVSAGGGGRGALTRHPRPSPSSLPAPPSAAGPPRPPRSPARRAHARPPPVGSAV